MNCPHCQVSLQMTERQGVEIDYCPQCRGVWLDRGELDKIIQRSTEMLPPQPNYRDEPGQPSQDDNRRQNDRGSFWGDLFDFFD